MDPDTIALQKRVADLADQSTRQMRPLLPRIRLLAELGPQPGNEWLVKKLAAWAAGLLHQLNALKAEAPERRDGT